MEGITVAEINKLQEENKNLREQLEWKCVRLSICKEQVELNKKVTEKLGGILEKVFHVLNEVEPELIEKYLKKEEEVLKGYLEYKTVG